MKYVVLSMETEEDWDGPFKAKVKCIPSKWAFWSSPYELDVVSDTGVFWYDSSGNVMVDNLNAILYMESYRLITKLIAAKDD